MKVLVTGIKGQLGYDVMNELTKRGHEAIGVDVEEMNLTDPLMIEQCMNAHKPEAVIHCAAWTAVDAAEDPANQDLVYSVNVEGTKKIAQMCQQLHCKMLFLSTDYVFDGQGATPWDPDCKNYSPLNVYGKTKLLGEEAVASQLEQYFIVRIAWVFGKNGNNFIKTMLKIGQNHEQLKVVSDQIGTPTYTFDLARLLVDMIETDRYGYYHATNEGGYISWYDFSVEIFRQAATLGHTEYSPEHLQILPVTTQEYGQSTALRPFNSRLDKSKLTKEGFTLLPPWQDALQRYLKDIL
ncbi:dTDP-4-dehydrorhamnose reductase [Anaerosporobacter faecicola]|uniref:dTDP-4-dehydrorhamnose reductase n=1 Tax=Anaerosporobacter faecicola TaxID=2718714 RepID=UPI00143CB22E|nr:dTDP-4-dehydrorhamnose reductase [Anaerosporobacter faecicola]